MIPRALLAPNPGKAAAERWYILYTPIWGLVAGAVMVSGAAAWWRWRPWGDLAYMVLGIGLWLGLLIGGYRRRDPADRGRPWHRLAHTKIQLWLLLFAVLGNYYSEYFYEILHMHYGFGTRWNINGVPAFLYPLTVVYFTTYATLISLSTRWLRAALPARAPRLLRAAAYLPACFAVALLETLLNANPFIPELFCYDDLPLALGFGTLMYGLWFVVTAPFWLALDERPGDDHGLPRVVLTALLGFALVIAVNEVIRDHVAPRFTDVRRGAVGLGDYGDNCLGPAPSPP